MQKRLKSDLSGCVVVTVVKDKGGAKRLVLDMREVPVAVAEKLAPLTRPAPRP